MEQKCGKNTIAIYRNWEKMKAKVSNFKNHQRFSMRCLDKGLFPVSLKLKNLRRTQRGRRIIQKAEKQLLNERIKSINYTLECYDHDRYMYKNELKELLEQDQEIWKACLEEIEKRREIRHKRVMERQTKKFSKLSKSWEEDQIPGSHSKHQEGPLKRTRSEKSLKNGLSISLTFLLPRTKRTS